MRNNVIFIWIPKCAGTSIFSALEKHGCRKLKDRTEYKHFNNSGWVTFGHVSTTYLLEKGVIRSDYFNKAYKFCVVRNPWDRLVSFYNYIKFERIMSFNEFVDFLYDKYMRRKSVYYRFLKPFYSISVANDILKLLNKLRVKAPLPDIGPHNLMGFSQLNNQADWVTKENGKLLVDYVCKFENIDEDFKNVCSSLGISETLPILNKSQHRSYRKYYNDDTISKVSEIYKRDAEMFGYEY